MLRSGSARTLPPRTDKLLKDAVPRAFGARSSVQMSGARSMACVHPRASAGT